MNAMAPSVQECLTRIRDILTQGRRQALQAVNTAMVQAYWQVGQEIIEEEQRGAGRAEYGTRLIETLARQLTGEFGKGFNARSLWFMRDVYLAFPILNALRSELSWTHYRLLARVQNPRSESAGARLLRSRMRQCPLVDSRIGASDQHPALRTARAFAG